jgi:predicted permease
LIDRKSASILTKLVVNIAIPANVLNSFLKRFDKALLSEFGSYILLGLLGIGISFLISKLVIKIFKVNAKRRGAFTVAFTFSNSVFIGFPIAYELFGDEGMPYAILYYLCNTILFWTLGYMSLKSDGSREEGVKFDVMHSLKKIINPPIVTTAVALMLVLFSVRLPAPVTRSLEYLAALTTPVSMIFTGIVLADMGIMQLTMERDIGFAMIGKIVIVPAIFCLLTKIIDVEGIGKSIFVMQASLPVILQIVIVSEFVGGDVEYTTKVAAWTTIVSVVTIPLFKVIVSLI